jgi:hypothetical protein
MAPGELNFAVMDMAGTLQAAPVPTTSSPKLKACSDGAATIRNANIATANRLFIKTSKVRSLKAVERE